ncbi:hypothetical protein RHMOL_Rhmol02G0225000 [Rhododendron molle]|uniref:Uncharacterized protein n=1 Tax=Rhododendron molle TaxID=49168 RepID=A0ACC0PVE3_RHOML|nr:hypothetical protein RHMOL_Rhmol02G0225000 [Rhododendron molle]
MYYGSIFLQVWERIAPGLASQFDSPYTIPIIVPRPLLMLNGEKDPRCPLEGLEIPKSRAHKAYEEAHCPDKFKFRLILPSSPKFVVLTDGIFPLDSQLIAQPGIGHEMTTFMVKEASDWFDRFPSNVKFLSEKAKVKKQRGCNCRELLKASQLLEKIRIISVSFSLNHVCNGLAGQVQQGLHVQIVCRLWKKNIQGNVKLDTDGWWYETNGKGGFGEIFRDQKGDWILGYYRKLKCDSSLEAEIWGIYRGNPDNHPQSVIINDAHVLLNRTGTTLTHIYRNANQRADHLACLGAEQNENLVVAVDIPISVSEYLIKDSLNIR